MGFSGQAPPAWYGPALIFVAVVVFPLWWCVVLAMLARMSGWSALAERFRADGVGGPGERFMFVSLAMPGPLSLPVSYNSCVWATVGPEGLGLSVLAIFRPFHPALKVPWAEVESVAPARSFLVSGSELRIKGHDRPIKVWGKAGEALLRLKPA